MDGGVLLVLAGLAGAAWGFVSDRLAARWPAHDDGSVRAIDWRTPLVVAVGAAAFALTVSRYGGDARALLLVGGYAVALVALFATDLDQRLLPDSITLPLIAFAILVLLAGWSPFIRTNADVLWAVIASIAIPAVLFVLAIPFGSGAIGQGDLKLLVSVGLFAGASRLFSGLVVGALAAGIVVGVLVLARRLTMRSYVPYGPFLILGALWSLLVVAQP